MDDKLLSSFMNTIHQGDCIELMQKLPENCIDLIITDPPFGIGFDKHSIVSKYNSNSYNRNKDLVIEGYKDIMPEDYLQFSIDWLSESYRILKSTGTAYVFSGWNNLKDLLIAIDNCGFITINHLIWKYQFGVFTKHKYVTSHYHCLFLCKDPKQYHFYPHARFNEEDLTYDGGSAHYQDKQDVWEINREFWRDEYKTPTKLPIKVIDKMLDYSSQKNDIVLDPFLGSGQVAIASRNKNRQYIGFEIVPDYYEFTLNRLESEPIQIRLF